MRRSHGSAIHAVKIAIKHRRSYFFTRSHDIRLGPSISGGALAGKIRYAIEMRFLVRRTHGNNFFRIAWIGDIDDPEALFAGSVLIGEDGLPLVSGCRHHDRSLRDQPLTGNTDGCLSASVAGDLMVEG